MFNRGVEKMNKENKSVVIFLIVIAILSLTNLNPNKRKSAVRINK